MEKNAGYKQKCKNCLSVWKYYMDYCLECGSDNLYEFHQPGCHCKQCNTLIHIVKFRPEIHER